MTRATSPRPPKTSALGRLVDAIASAVETLVDSLDPARPALVPVRVRATSGRRRTPDAR